MKRGWNIFSQVILGLGQTVNVVEPVLPPKTKLAVTGGLALAQLAISIIAHNSNPDGTPAQSAWNPGK